MKQFGRPASATDAATRLLAGALWLGVVLSAGIACAQDETPDAAAASTTAELAPDEWPYVSLDPESAGDEHTLDRGPGHYVSLGKLIFFWIVFLAWVGVADWVNRDCQQLRLNHYVWNPVVVFPFFAAILLLWLIPMFLVGAVLLVLAFFGTAGAYVVTRNKQVEDHQKVLTPDHIRHWFAARLKRVGVKVEAEKKADYEKGAPVELVAQGGASNVENNANLLTARQSAGFVVVKDLIADALGRRGNAIMMDFTPDAVAVRYQIDGMWHATESRDRESGDAVLAVMKTLAALDANQRVQRQQGAFAAQYKGTRYACKIVSQGTETGERAVVRLDDGASQFESFTELGLREKLVEPVRAPLESGEGFVLLATMPSGGLSTLLHVVLEESDRLMRNFVAIEEEGRKEIDVQNVEATTWSAAAGQTPASVMPDLLRTYPDVIVCPDLPDAGTVAELSEFAADGKLVISTIRAKDAPEALLRVLALKVPVKAFAPAARLVVAVRLIRKLCTACRVAYEPPAETLQKMGIPPGRINVLYREPRPEEVEQRCGECYGIGFRGRTGLFEVLTVDDKVREVLIKQPKLDVLRKAARAAGMKTLQEEGVLLVAKGETSLSELMRVLKQ